MTRAQLPYILPRLALSALSLTGSVSAQAPPTGLNPAVTQIVDAISQERIAANLKRLESFGTRYVLSAQEDPSHGIGAAKRWIHDELQAYSSRLEVTYQNFVVKKGARQGQIIRDVELSNVIAVLPGTIHKDHYVLVTGHYDSLAVIRKPYTGEEQRVAEAVRRGIDENEERRFLKILPPEDALGPMDFEATAAQPIAPGVTDDASGTAAVMELARVMSGHRFDKTIVFIAFAGEEVGLSGSQAYATMAKQKGTQIEAVLNNDIIGSDVAGNGRSASNVLRVFAAGPEDSPSRELGRYMQQVAQRYVPSMQVELIFRGDRFLRGGDHTPFVNQGYAAVRLTTPSEHYANQHSTTDTFANTSVPYTTRVVRMNAAVLASLALAPAPPVLNWTWSSGPNKDGHVPLLTRGKSGYDAVLHWYPNTEEDLAGYAVTMRSTTSPVWERETWVGNVTTFTMPDVSIDDVVIGVKALDKDGNQSVVSPYMEPVLPSQITPATAQ
jgi:putative aminopeptidase FrvX